MAGSRSSNGTRCSPSRKKYFISTSMFISGLALRLRGHDSREIQLGLGNIAHEVGEQELSCEAGDGHDVGVGKPRFAYVSESLIAYLATRVCDSVGEADGGSALWIVRSALAIEFEFRGVELREPSAKKNVRLRTILAAAAFRDSQPHGFDCRNVQRPRQRPRKAHEGGERVRAEGHQPEQIRRPAEALGDPFEDRPGFGRRFRQT